MGKTKKMCVGCRDDFTPYYEEDGIVIYHGDCRDILPGLEFDSVVMDPPYGIGWDGHGLSTTSYHAFDDSAADLRWILRMECPVVCFGASCFPDQLPHRGRWLCWDKRTIDGAADAMLGSPFELAWINRKSGYDQMCRVLHGGVVNADGGKRFHPTQKPIAVMQFAILRNTGDGMSVCDPYMGSGSTLLAAKNLGRRAIGIEIDERYCETAANRLAQGVLFGVGT